MKIEVEQVCGHFEIYINGEFYCSADSLHEVDQALEEVQGK